MRKSKRRHRRAAVFFLAAAAVALGAGAYFVNDDQPTHGYAAIAGGAGFAVAGASLLVISRKF